MRLLKHKKSIPALKTPPIGPSTMHADRDSRLHNPNIPTRRLIPSQRPQFTLLTFLAILYFPTAQFTISLSTLTPSAKIHHGS
jgi:hypothetical protein